MWVHYATNRTVRYRRVAHPQQDTQNQYNETSSQTLKLVFSSIFEVAESESETRSKFCCKKWRNTEKYGDKDKNVNNFQK